MEVNNCIHSCSAVLYIFFLIHSDLQLRCKRKVSMHPKVSIHFLPHVLVPPAYWKLTSEIIPPAHMRWEQWTAHTKGLFIPGHFLVTHHIIFHIIIKHKLYTLFCIHIISYASCRTSLQVHFCHTEICRISFKTVQGLNKFLYNILLKTIQRVFVNEQNTLFFYYYYLSLFTEIGNRSVLPFDINIKIVLNLFIVKNKTKWKKCK